MTLSKKEYLDYIKGDIESSRRSEIDLYLSQHPLERKALEGAIANNQVHSFDDLVDLLEEQVNQTVSTGHVSHSSNNNKAQKTKSFKMWPYITSAAAAAALIVFFILPNNSSDIQVKAYFDAYPDLVSGTVRGDISSTESELSRALSAYNQDDHARSAELLEVVIQENPVDQRLPFYRAVSLVGIGEYDKALPLLKELADDPAFPYMDGVIWNLGLCQLGLNNLSAAKRSLILVAENNVYKKKEAQELLKKI